MSSQATRSNDANRETPHGGMNGPTGGDSPSETGREFAASREDYNFDDDENDASEDGGSGDEHTGASAEEELRRLMRYADAPDYYSLLGLSRTPPPTDGQIRSAFQRLSLSFHPDKQPLHLRRVARDQYSKIQRAYNTLLDPQKRVVYDLIGEEGVNAEWGAGGAMSKGGEAQDSQVGLRTMTSAEFRQWFLGLMQRRERSTLENMIGSRGSLSLTLDAIPFFQWINLVPVLEDQTHLSSRIAGVHLSHSFKVPVPWLKSTHSIGLPSNTPSYQRFRTEESPFRHTVSKDPALVVNTAVSGTIQRPKQHSILKLSGTDEEVTREVALPPMLISRQFLLDSSMAYTVPEAPGNMTGFKKRAWRLMQGCGLELGGTLLPDPTFYTAIERQFTPLSGTQPIVARAETTFHYPIHEMPPVAHVMLSRRLAPDQEVYCSWTSKQNFWDDFPVRAIVDVLHLGVKDGLYQLVPGNFEIGYKARSSELLDDRESSRTEEDQDSTGSSKKASSRPAWGFSLESSGHDAGLSITYSRDVFGRSRTPLALSSWSAEEYHAQSEELFQEPNPVRLTIETNIGIDGSLSGSIGGSRKVGNFTRIGLSVDSVGGVVMFKLRWNRLGQDAQVPIIVCPPELFNPDVVKAALVVPWATFLLVEFGILRPRARRKWQKAVEDRRRQLTKLVARRRVESAQAIELMTSQVKRRQNDEKSKDGLLIIHAEYGVRKKAARRKASANVDASTDVTIPVAALVHNGQLSLPRKVKKSHILGFHDPAPLSRKTLSVRYRFGGAEHFVEVNENESLLCPMKEHRLSSIDELD